MTETLPLFPLGTVLFPGLLLPLHIFEERYRRLVRDLLDQPEPRRFGVIAIREGRETGEDGVRSLFEIGCTATLRRVMEHADGRFDLVTVGTQRFRLVRLDGSGPYLRGDVELLPEPVAAQEASAAQEAGRARATDAARAANAVQEAFRGYLDALAGRNGTQVSVPDLPDDPAALSYLVAASTALNLGDRQALLAEPHALSRLAAERVLLQRETAMLRTLTLGPAPGLYNPPYNPN